MKKTNIFIMTVIMGLALMTSCANRQMTAPSQPQPVAKSNPLGTEIDIPCVYESMDDDEYFRALGQATSINMQSARSAAMDAAQDMITKRLGGFVQGLSTSYSRTVSGQAPADKVQRMMEGEMNKVVEQMVNHAQKTCEKMFQDENDGNYKSFISIQIPKKAMIDNMVKGISQNEELEIEFNRDLFRKYAEEKMAKMKEDAAPKGYN